MTTFADWLALREPADAAARATDLADRLRLRPPLVIHDLGSGTGSMARWLAPRLPGPQHWVLHDRDPGLLARAAADPPTGTAVETAVETRQGDLTRLTEADLAGASLVTASALLDMLTAAEVERVVAACAGHPTLLTLSVIGRVQFVPADPLDAALTAAFNDHQRRTVEDRTLLGPDAAAAAVSAFRRRGIAVQTRFSPWRLTPGALLDEWLAGWLDAACGQRPELAEPAAAYRERRRADSAAGRLSVTVGHQDVLAEAD